MPAPHGQMPSIALSLNVALHPIRDASVVMATLSATGPGALPVRKPQGSTTDGELTCTLVKLSPSGRDGSRGHRFSDATHLCTFIIIRRPSLTTGMTHGIRPSSRRQVLNGTLAPCWKALLERLYSHI